MDVHSRRFVFIDFENLTSIKFKKLEKVATKIFIFVPTEVDHIPSKLVYQMQKLGKDVRWITVGNTKGRKMNYQIAFLMGKLHQKLHLDVEFAVLSNDKDLDPLIHFINSQNRSCLRVKRKKTAAEKVAEADIIPSSPIIEQQTISSIISEDYLNGHDNLDNSHFELLKEVQPSASVIEQEYDKMVVDKTAEETVERLIRSGNRPAEISMLKHYILLNNDDENVQSNVEQIIEKMRVAKNIAIENGAVIYNF